MLFLSSYLGFWGIFEAFIVIDVFFQKDWFLKLFKYIQLRLTVNAVPSHYGHVWNTDAILGHLIYSCQHFDAQISHLRPIDAVGVIYCLIVFPVHLLPWGFRLINFCRTIGIILCLALCASGKNYFALLITLFVCFPMFLHIFPISLYIYLWFLGNIS